MKRRSKFIHVVAEFGTLGGLADTDFGTVRDGYETPKHIAMTTPVFISGGATNATMAFVIAAKMRPVEVMLRIEAAWLLGTQSSSDATPDTAILTHQP